VNADLARVAELTSKLARSLYDLTAGALGAGVRPGPSMIRNTTLLNLNVPLEWNGKVKHARLGARIYEEVIDFRTDPRGREYLWLGGPGVSHARDEGSDTDAYDDGYASVTPLVLDLTSSADGARVEKVLELG